MERRYIESFFFLALLLATLALVFFMLKPFLSVLVLAAVLAFLFSGLFERFAHHMRHRSLAALATTLIVLIAILLPLVIAGLQLAREAAGLYEALKDYTSMQQLRDTLDTLERFLSHYVPGIDIGVERITERLQSVTGWLVNSLGAAFASFGRLVLNFILLLLFFFYLVRDGHRLKRRLMDLSPLSDERENQVIDRIAHAITATVRGTLTLAFLQGFAATIGFAIFGVPNPVLWGSFVILTAFVPTIGTALVNIPAIIYLFSTGHTSAAVGLAIWAGTIVGALDNVLGPALLAHSVRMHPLVILISVLGGISMFGPMGVLLGPIVLALLYALLDIYLTIIRPPTES